MGMVAGAEVVAGACVAAGVVGLAVSKQSWCEYAKGCGALGERNTRGLAHVVLRPESGDGWGRVVESMSACSQLTWQDEGGEAPAVVLLGAAVDVGVSIVVGVAEVAAHEGQGHR